MRAGRHLLEQSWNNYIHYRNSFIGTFSAIQRQPTMTSLNLWVAFWVLTKVQAQWYYRGQARQCSVSVLKHGECIWLHPLWLHGLQAGAAASAPSPIRRLRCSRAPTRIKWRSPLIFFNAFGPWRRRSDGAASVKLGRVERKLRSSPAALNPYDKEINPPIWNRLNACCLVLMHS